MNQNNNISSFPVKNSRTSGEGPIGTGGGDGHNGDMEDLKRRVGTLETKMDKVQETLHAITVTLAKIEATMVTKDDISPVRSDVAVIKTALDAKATSASVAEIKGHVDALPTMPKLSALLAVGLGGATIILGVYHHGIAAQWW